MIIVFGRIAIAEDSRHAAINAIHDLQKQSRTEQGCLAYTFCPSLEDAITFFWFECWENHQCFLKHSESKHVEVFKKRLSEITVLEQHKKIVRAEEI